MVLRPAGGAQTSVRRHGELGPERLRGAEDPAGRRGVLLVLPDGADHGGRPRNLPPGKELWLKYEICDENATQRQQGAADERQREVLSSGPDTEPCGTPVGSCREKTS